MMKLLKAGKRAVQSHIVSHVSEKEQEKIECNDSNEFGKKRDLQKQEERCSTKWKLIME